MAHQEGVMCEEVQILSESKEDTSVKVKVHARVMGKWQHIIIILAVSESYSCWDILGAMFKAHS